MSTLSLSLIKHVLITTHCPNCGEETATDKGHCSVENLLPTQGFWCETCGNNFSIQVNWGDMLNDAIKAASG